MSPAATALVLYVTYLLVTFGLRGWLHHRNTGTAGFNGFTERHGSAGWWGGILFAVAVLTGLAAPILQLAGIIRPIATLANAALFVAGLAVTAVGAGLTLTAQRAMGRSWRVGVDHNETTDLVRTGMFAFVRNPIFTTVILTATGLALIAPNPVAIAAVLILVAAIELQVRTVEEPYLLTVHGDTYLDYARTVGRFIPGIGKLTGHRH